ncbi:preprotein translocase subunit SecG [Shewanella loihica]|uniref:Protein-export membrane protein SecG n=1 Tax=Shewanella loihica (strain ATCC BAA-1088 / PV-4) TaxID=323850 RepID=A3QGU8_SHELP|nr:MULTISPECIES: preprotein translocase subunit SecG [Shewanella]ABO24696.1 protein translocase subunit secG [Shewanella loihica PV-4]QYJ81501.1 preprotein translocase subunit SecG [Shewanella aegiceratis]QYJ91041.1 preprotein translocase subunit SecG [Shewanella halotolerans]QYJ92859.1 preprotein translocase subunit SecG [Shewanella spartinae]QYJ96736.1 preprotein translocase subunit SecG [Shewanella alkalitolerans]
MYEVLMVIYLLVALGLIGLILIQQGKGADMGASFGAGASATLFGSSGSGNFLTRSTAILAIAFFALSLTIGNLSANHAKTEESWKDLGADAAAVTEQVTDAAKDAQKSEDKIPD